jgi:hypothetical protein
MTESSFGDIPGATLFDGRMSRIGYHLNMFCMSLIKAENRAPFKAGEASYLDRFSLTADQRRAVLELRATLDWSYELLTEPERVVLRRLAIFLAGLSDDAALPCDGRREEPEPVVEPGRKPLYPKGGGARYRTLDC